VARDAGLLAALLALLAGCGGADEVVEPPRPAVADAPAAHRVAAQFVNTAVARENVGASWAVTHPDLRAGYTRATWAEGTIPVQPVPGARAAPGDFRLIQADADELVYAVRIQGRRFLVTVKPYGTGPRWGVAGFDAAIAPG
jgi:hypothetical protein